MNAVVIGLKLGGLVDHIFRGGDLAAVVQPGPDAKLAPGLFTTESEISQRAFRSLLGRPGQHHRQLGHPLAVATRVGTLGINRSGQEGDHRIDQLLLGLEQLGALDAHRRLAGQGLNQVLIESIKGPHQACRCVGGEERVGITFAIDQLHHTDRLTGGGAHRHGEHRHGAIAELQVDRPVEPVGQGRIQLVDIRDVQHLAAERTPAHQPFGGEREADIGHGAVDVLIDATRGGGSGEAGVLRDGEPELIGAAGVAAHIAAFHQEDAAGITAGELPGFAQDQLQQRAQITRTAEGGGDVEDLDQRLFGGSHQRRWWCHCRE